MPRDFSGRSAIADRVRLQHMLDAARQVKAFVAGRKRADLDHDDMLVRAVMNALQEIGEAAANLGDDARSRVEGVPWGQIVETRNILIHVCWAVDRDKVWATATRDMDPLIAAISAAISNWPLPRSS